MKPRSDVVRSTRRDRELAPVLGALGNPTRIAILRALRTPRALRELRVSNVLADRTTVLSRQNVKKHLERLVEGGLAYPKETRRSYGSTVEYVLDQQVVFGLSEALRELARIEPEVRREVETQTLATSHERRLVPAPCLIVVKGVVEGLTFPLAPARSEWVVGRSPDADLSLPFDPFLSAENCIIRRREGGFVVADILSSRNGTMVDFQPVPRGGEVPLRPGSIIGVGRCLLVFRS